MIIPGMIEVAIKKNEKQIANVSFEVKSVEDIPFHREAHDVIMAWYFAFNSK